MLPEASPTGLPRPSQPPIFVLNNKILLFLVSCVNLVTLESFIFKTRQLLSSASRNERMWEH